MSHDLRITARVTKNPAKIENKFTIQGGSKLEVLDEDGGKLYEGEFKSFTSNFLKLLYGSMVGAGTAKAKDLSNNDIEMNTFPQSALNLKGGLNVKKFGVVVGTNSTAVSASDYAITVPASLTVNNTVVSASSVGADSISVEISRQISNSSGSAVSLKEAGLICGLSAEIDTNVLIARDLLDLTLENSQKSTWRYTINFNFANDIGGFVKTLCDYIFTNLFWQATSGANWSARTGFGCIVYDNKMWVLGGIDGLRRNDVWCSSILAEIRPGSSDSAFSATETALGSLIADGNDPGELVYGAMPGAGTVEPTVSGNKTKMSIAREFTNNSGADITVREVGLFSGSDMLARLILATPVTITNGGSEIITVDFETEV